MPSYPEALRSKPVRIGVSLLALSSFAIGIRGEAAVPHDGQQVITESMNDVVVVPPEALAQSLGQVSVSSTTLPEAKPVAPPAPKVHTAAKPLAAPKPPAAPADCESFRPLVAQYDWSVDTAMLVISKESGCDPNNVSATNDYGLMGLHNMEIFDPAANIAAGYQKYIHPRRGSSPNWSAWYTVCSPSEQPKYDGVNC